MIEFVFLMIIVMICVYYSQQRFTYTFQTGRRTSFLTGLMFIGVGTGGIKANVGPFGAQQLEQLGAEAVQSFFNWFVTR